MPCWTVTTIQVNVGKWNQERAAQAIRDVGAQAHVSGGKLTVDARSPEQGNRQQKEIVQKYAELTLKTAAKRFGWKASPTVKTDKGLSKLTLTR